MSRFHIGAAAFAAVVVLASAVTWNWSGSGDRGAGNGGFATSGQPAATRDIGELLAASDADDFFGIPISPRSTGIIVDNRERLGPYADKVARLAFAASEFANSQQSDFGIVEARLQAAGDFSTEVDPFYALPVIRIQTLMKKVVDKDRSHLNAAVALTAPWTPEQIFVIISEQLSYEEEIQLGAAIRAAGVPVHIVGLGDAATQSYASLAAAAHGRYIPVNDAVLDQLIQRCPVDLPSRAK